MKNYKHYLATRFNLKFADWKTTKNLEAVLTQEWLNHRMDLFEKFCLPSVNYQSNKNFIWLIFLDTDTPKENRKSN